MKNKYNVIIFFSVMWLVISIIISINWLNDLSIIFGGFLSVLITLGIAYIPGYISMNLLITLLFFSSRKKIGETTQLLSRLYIPDLTILIPVFNEERTIYHTLESIDKQDYNGKIKVIVINNNSTDLTMMEVKKAMRALDISIVLINEEKKGKSFALNKGLRYVSSMYFITLDADTILHTCAIRYIIERVLLCNRYHDVAAVAGGVLVSNGRENMITRIQKYDYLLSITSIKRMQGIFSSTLVAQGAFSLYRTELIRCIGGWYDCIGEDIVLTWKLLQYGLRVEFEPRAVCFTFVPNTLSGFLTQRARWARGMIEGLKRVPPNRQCSIYTKYLTTIDAFIPFIDFSYLIFFIPGIILALLGKFYLVGFLTLLVLPLTLISNLLMYRIEKKEVLDELMIKLDIHFWDYLIFILLFQSLNSFASIIGYLQELFRLKRKWK